MATRDRIGAINAIGAELGLSLDELRAFAVPHTGVPSLRSLNWEQAGKVIEQLKERQPNGGAGWKPRPKPKKKSRPRRAPDTIAPATDTQRESIKRLLRHINADPSAWPNILKTWNVTLHGALSSRRASQVIAGLNLWMKNLAATPRLGLITKEQP